MLNKLESILSFQLNSMHKTLLLLILILSINQSFAGKISGTIYDEKNAPLAYASILIKENGHGTTANQQGHYSFDLNAGNYTIIVQYVGYARQEKKIRVGNENIQLDFKLQPQQLKLSDVVVTSGGEDPAYAIIRNAIKKREEYRTALDSFK